MSDGHHHTLSADTLSTRSFLVDGRPLAPFAAFRSHVLRCYLKRVKVTPSVYPRSAISGKKAEVSAQSHR